MEHITITDKVLDVNEASRVVGTPAAGAISVFIGTTRDNFEGKQVVELAYEAYTEMAKQEINKICKQMREKWDLQRIAFFHRTGVVAVGEASVVIAVSSAHRKNAMHAAEYAIDTLKAAVPIWKKEVFAEGEPMWKENKECAWGPQK